MDALGHVAGFEERVETGSLGAGKSEGGLSAQDVEPECFGRGRGGAERAVGPRRVPEPVVGWHHGRPHAHGNFIAGHQCENQFTARKALGLCKREHGRDHHRARVQQGQLVGVVVVGRVHEDAVRERGDRWLGAHVGRADHRRSGGTWIELRKLVRDPRLFRILTPRTQSTADGVGDDETGLLDD